MVGHKFIEALKEKDAENKFNVVTFCEERRAAYNRMRLTEVLTLFSIETFHAGVHADVLGDVVVRKQYNYYKY